MVTQLKTLPTELPIDSGWHPTEINYPDDNGEPLSDNTRQLAWIILIKTNLDALFATDPNVFIAGDLLWYPTEGNNKRSAAPDVMIVFGRPKDHRRSYKQWEEDNIPPQVVFEVLSHCNTAKEMEKKLAFYNEYGVEEYYLYDPEDNNFRAWIRGDVDLELVALERDWISSRLGIRFDLTDGEMKIWGPDDRLFTTYEVTSQQLKITSQQLNTTNQQLSTTNQQLDSERVRSQILADKLRELGIDPTTLT